MRSWLVFSMLSVVATAGCSTQAPSGRSGYGTPGVSRFMPDAEADSLSAQVARCRTPSSPEMAASCRQLHTTMQNQPGNTVVR